MSIFRKRTVVVPPVKPYVSAFAPIAKEPIVTTEDPILVPKKQDVSFDGYSLTDLGDNNTGFGEWVIVTRDDGFGFGAMEKHHAAGIIAADRNANV